LRIIDWIWHVRGQVPLATGQSGEEALARLEPLFNQPGTTYERAEGTLSFRKKDQLAQDKMSVFDSGVLQIEPGATGPNLRYRLASRALLFCFLAPLLFLALAQLTITVGSFQKPSADAAKKAEDKKKADIPQNPIDKFLGAPAPEKPKDDKKDAGKDKSKDKDEGSNDKPSPTSAYVFAGIFAALYVAGRMLEDWLAKRLFRKALQEA
jgi:hypothetical protein